MAAHPVGGHGFHIIDFKDVRGGKTGKQAAKEAQQAMYDALGSAPPQARINSIDLMEDPQDRSQNLAPGVGVKIRPPGVRLIIDVEVPGTMRGDDVAHTVIMQVATWAAGLSTAANVAKAEHFCCISDMGP